MLAIRYRAFYFKKSYFIYIHTLTILGLVYITFYPITLSDTVKNKMGGTHISTLAHTQNVLSQDGKGISMLATDRVLSMDTLTISINS